MWNARSQFCNISQEIATLTNPWCVIKTSEGFSFLCELFFVSWSLSQVIWYERSAFCQYGLGARLWMFLWTLFLHMRATELSSPSVAALLTWKQRGTAPSSWHCLGPEWGRWRTVNWVRGPRGTPLRYAIVSHYTSCITTHLHLKAAFLPLFWRKGIWKQLCSPVREVVLLHTHTVLSLFPGCEPGPGTAQ